jgi:hypothetical protein
MKTFGVVGEENKKSTRKKMPKIPLGGQIIYFIYKNCQALPPSSRNQLIVPKTNQEINESSYEMVGVKITVTNYGQSKSYFCHFFSC